MKILLMTVLLACLAFSTTGCVFVHTKTPYDTDLDNTVLGEGVKAGESDWTSILWLFAWGDASTAAAAQDGDITTLHHMDREILSILFGLYHKETTIVYGE